LNRDASKQSLLGDQAPTGQALVVASIGTR
jgi:hypothetical protein